MITGKWRLLSLAVLFALSSCSSVAPQKEEVIRQQQVKPVEIPMPLAPQMEKEKKIQTDGPKQFYSFSFREADLKDVCRAISKQTDYNMIVEPDVNGIITLDLKEVMLRKALEYILEPLNYTFRIDGRTIYVSKPKLQTKIFPVNYIALTRAGRSTVAAQTGSTGTTGGTTGGTYASTTGTGTTGAPGATGGGSMGSMTLTSTTESDLWKNLEDNLKSLLSPEGKIAVNRQGMMIFVTDYPKYLNNIGMFLEAIEGTIHRQVMIEAKIAEVQLNKESREGVNWSLIQAQIRGTQLKGSQTFLNPSPTPLTTSSAISPQPLFRFFVGGGNIDLNNTFIDLLKTQGNVNIISSPKISTLNNQRAVIKVARQDVYFVGTQSSTGVGGSLATYSPNFMTVGLILDVIPQIDNNGTIILNVHPMLTEKIGTARAPDGSEVPILDVREADTIVRVKEGDTVVIGGLIKNYWTRDRTGVQGLSSVPLIGGLFRLTEEQNQKSELVVFLTPRVIHVKDNDERNP